MTRRWVVLALLLIALPPHTANAYLELTASFAGEEHQLRWNGTPRWFATDRGVPQVSAAALQATVARAVTTWQSVATSSIGAEFAGFTRAEPFEDDGLSVIGFVDEPELERTLGATTFTVDVLTGEILEADIFFNAAFPWSTAASGDPARFDLESVALHELGHFFGLGHSGLGETVMLADGGRRVLASGAVMFPIAFGRGVTLDRQLQPDDIAGISHLYPDGGFREDSGAARGRVIRGSGAGVIGAHVIAYNQKTGQMVAGFSVNGDGEFEIDGLTPGPHVIRVEPLNDAEVTSFFDASVDVNFGATFYERLFVAPEGGVGEHFTVTVRPR